LKEERRIQRKEIQALSSESAWLQKALFALGKAEDARDALAELRRKEPGAFELELDGKVLSVAEVGDLAKIPDKETLQSQLASMFLGPLRVLASATQSLLSHFAGCVEKRRKDHPKQ